MRKNCAKVRKKNICAKIAQILRKKYSHFVETLLANAAMHFKTERDLRFKELIE